jgi:hypothetical protein
MVGAMPGTSRPGPLRRVAVLGALVLLVAAAVAGGLGLGRDTAPRARSTLVVHYNASPYWPLASQTFKGVYDGEHVTQFLPQGIPFGWPHTERGAVAAATEILKVAMSPVVFGAPLVFSNAYSGTSLQEEELATWGAVAPNAASVIDDAQRDGMFPQMQGWPLAYKVESGALDKVVVDIWAVQVFVLPNQLPFSQHWFTERITAQWFEQSGGEVENGLAVRSDWTMNVVTMTDGPVAYDADAEQEGGETPPGQLGWTSYGS